MNAGPVDGPPLEVEMFRNSATIVVAVSGNLADLLGKPSSSLIHHEDQHGAVSTWFAMIGDPGVEYVWGGRHLSLRGTWHWVESVNSYARDAADDATVRTRMRPVNGAEVSVAERLREREQLLGRRSDALPVGLFQFDAQRRDPRTGSSSPPGRPPW